MRPLPLILLILLSLAACSSDHGPPRAKGEWFTLNAHVWQPPPDLLRPGAGLF